MYQTIKNFLEEKKKAKFMQEIGCIASANNINLKSISELTYAMNEFSLQGTRADVFNVEKVSSAGAMRASPTLSGNKEGGLGGANV